MTFWFNTENSVTNLNYTFLSHIAIMTLAGLVGICLSRTLVHQYARVQSKKTMPKPRAVNGVKTKPAKKLFYISDDYLLSI